MSQEMTKGLGLESRVQRLFLAQGIYAERGLNLSADQEHKMMATDIDILTTEYASGFHLTRKQIECKGGKTRLLDRILWLRGLKELVKTDTSYLVLPNFNESASDFARALEVDVFTVDQLGIWENAFGIPADHWPNRSNFQVFDTAKRRWWKSSGEKNALRGWSEFRKATQFAEIDSWFHFQYSLLNKLFRMLELISEQYKSSEDNSDLRTASKYVASALLVRLSQFLLGMCYDLTQVPMSDIDSYLSRRLTFGDQDPQKATKLIQSTIQWIERGLEEANTKLPSSVIGEKLFAPRITLKSFLNS